VAGLAVGGPALFICVLDMLAGMAQYAEDNATRCGGGLGRIGPGLFLYAMFALALLVTLATLVFALVVEIGSRHWGRMVGLLVATAAAGVLLTAGADSRVSHTLVGSLLGFGCSSYWQMVAASLAPLLVAVSTIICLMTERRRE
jgi:hypothetical protein